MTRLLLDIDGVINTVNRNPENHWSDWQRRKIMGFYITYSASVIQFFCQLSQVIDVRWLTTWGHFANEYFGPGVGMPPLAVCGEPALALEGDEWWKLVLARELYEADGERFIWLDDDIRFDLDSVEWLNTLPEGSYLAISPDTGKGLLPEHLDMIAAFVEKGA